MPVVKDVTIKFKQSVAVDVAKNRIRIRPGGSAMDYNAPYDDINKPTPGTDGYSRIPLSAVSRAKGIEGKYDIHLTAVDSVGNESDPLQIDNVTFDLSPPAAPTDGSLE